MINIQKDQARVQSIVFLRRENELISQNLNPVKACNIKGVGFKSKTKVIVVSPEIAWKIAMDLPLMFKTLVLLAAGTGMRISKILGSKEICDEGRKPQPFS